MSLKNLTVKKTNIITILLYISAFFSPLLFNFFSKEMMITATTVTYALGACLMIWLYFKSKTNTLTEKDTKFSSPGFIALFGITGIFLSLIIQGIVFSIESALTGAQPSSENTEAIISTILLSPLFILATTIAGPIMEEFVFRRSLIGLTEPYVGFWLSAFISSALFSLIHQDGHFFVYFCMGLFFAILYKLTGKIWTSIIAHCGMNGIVVILQLLIHYLDIPTT